MDYYQQNDTGLRQKRSKCAYASRNRKTPPGIPPITINDRKHEQLNYTRQLIGVTLSRDLTWQIYSDEITDKASLFIIPHKQAGVEPHHLVKL